MDNNMILIKGNCVETMNNLKDNSVDLIVTDPPYNLGNFMRNRATNLKKMRNNFFGDAGWDDLEFEDWIEHMDSFFEQSQRILKKGGSIIMFMSLIKVETIIKLAEKNKFYYKTTGVWHKTNPMPRNMNLHFINSVEGWIYFTNITKTGTFNNNGTAIHDYIESSVTPKSEKIYGGHPTQKPEKVIQHFVELLSNPGEVVMDPFMGSGTTGVVAKKLGRDFIGIELQEDYFDISLKRISDVSTNKKYELKVINGD
ncbi:site-specific DNA-methyltransferase [Clostridium sp. VAP23]|uniref:DNA-methyltransferase n=1 Tax=Clostridium sp. VAP23 TaxID=2949981 RepID=UPI00207984D6|nr:site-specific DNA-methyltransferase [Clostridium sp. VAP23]